MYAERKKIPLEDVRIRLTHHRRDPGKDDARAPMDAIEGYIQLTGDLSASQRRRLLDIAGKCWMHRTLSAGVAIRFHSEEERVQSPTASGQAKQQE